MGGGVVIGGAQDAYETFDHRSRRLGKHDGLACYFATDPCNGLDERLPRLRTLLIGPWRVSLTRRRARANRGSATVAVFLFSVILGALFLLALGVGQQAMCSAYDDSLRYCPGYEAQR